MTRQGLEGLADGVSQQSQTLEPSGGFIRYESRSGTVLRITPPGPGELNVSLRVLLAKSPGLESQGFHKGNSFCSWGVSGSIRSPGSQEFWTLLSPLFLLPALPHQQTLLAPALISSPYSPPSSLPHPIPTPGQATVTPHSGMKFSSLSVYK